MKKIFLLFCLASGYAQAQTTHMIDWFFGVSPSATSITIEEGDSVTWTWTDNMPHTVTSMEGSEISFDSGILSGAGQTFTFAFPSEGTAPYRCALHANMVGTINVVPSMGTSDANGGLTSMAPNPASDVLDISSDHQLDRVALYTMSGVMLWESPVQTANVRLYVGGYPSGSYIVHATSGASTFTRTLVKQ